KAEKETKRREKIIVNRMVLNWASKLLKWTELCQPCY
ncbi:MAG: hypothetical protein ACI9UR_000787, partial [Bacteroidia bacterium]